MYYSSQQSVQPCSVASVESGNIHCLEPGCTFRIHRLKQFQHHLTTEHGFEVQTLTLYFENLPKFYAWKDEYEKQHGFTFSMLTTKARASHVYYYCSLGRKARFVNGKKRMSNQCPTRLVLNSNRNTGQVYVELIEGHYGHPLPVLDDSVPEQLSKKDIQVLKEVMRLHNFDKNSVEQYFNNAEITSAKKDLFMREYEKKKFHEVYRWAETSFSAESPVTVWNRLMPETELKAIIMHKRKGEIIADLRHQNCHHRHNLEGFPVETFMLGVMSDRQRDILLQYGSTIVLELVLPQESAPGDTIKQLYVLVMDHLGRELQVGFFVVNCPDTDTRAFRSFFLAMKIKCGNLKPKLLIVNERSCLFSSWLDVFNDHVPGQLLSPWFIEAEFNSLMIDSMIPDIKMQELEDLFMNTVREFDLSKFEAKLAYLINSLNAVPGAHEALNYVTGTLLPDLNKDSSSPVQPKWAHHAFPESKEDIAMSIMTFTPERLKGLHNFSNRKLGRCVYLMVQRQLQRRQLRSAQKPSPGSRPAQAIVADTAVETVVHNPPINNSRQQERQSQTADLKERCQRLLSQLKNIPNDKNIREISEKILQVTKSFHKSDNGKHPAFQMKIAEDLYRNINPDCQSDSVSPSLSSTDSEKSSSCPTGTNGKRVLNFNPNILNVKRNSNKGPIALSSYSSANRSNKKRKLSPSLIRSSATDVHVSDESDNCMPESGKNYLHPVFNTVKYSPPSLNPFTFDKPITVDVSNQILNHLEISQPDVSGHTAFAVNHNVLGEVGGSAVALDEINQHVELYGSNNMPVATSQAIPYITYVSNAPTVPSAVIPVQMVQPSANLLAVPSLWSTNLQESDISTSAIKVEEDSLEAWTSQVVLHINSIGGDDILTKVKEEKDTDDKGFSPRKILEINAEDVQDPYSCMA